MDKEDKLTRQSHTNSAKRICLSKETKKERK